MRRFYNKGAKGLSGGQVKLDKMGNNDGKISGEDFAVMRSRKMGGGMMKRPMYKAGSANPKAKSKTSMKQAKAGMESQKATNKKAIKIAKTISKFNPLTIGITAADTVKRNKKMGGGMMEEAKEINSKIKNSRTLKMGGGMMKRPMYKDGSKTQDALRAAARDMNKTGQGKKFREATFVDSKTNRIVPDTERNRKRYGKDRVKATTAKGRVKKAGGGGLYANIKAKKDRIAAGSGEKMRKVGTKGAPTAQNFINAAKTAKKV